MRPKRFSAFIQLDQQAMHMSRGRYFLIQATYRKCPAIIYGHIGISLFIYFQVAYKRVVVAINNIEPFGFCSLSKGLVVNESEKEKNEKADLFIHRYKEPKDRIRSCNLPIMLKGLIWIQLNFAAHCHLCASENYSSPD